MNTPYDLLDESTMDVEDLEAECAMQLAAVSAIRRARQFNTAYIIFEDGQIREIAPEATRPYEDNLLMNTERLRQRIRALKPSAAADFSLNDKPVK